MIRGNFATRHEAKDSAADIVGLLRKTNMPTAWVLNASCEASSAEPTAIDVLKQIVLQVLKINWTLLDERSLSLNGAKFQSATSESDWFDLLGSALTGLPSLHLVIDTEVVKSRLPYDFSWPAAFHKLSDDLSARCIATPIKVILVSYGTGLPASRGVLLGTADGTVIIIGKKSPTRRFPRGAVQRRGVEVLQPFLVHTTASI